MRDESYRTELAIAQRTRSNPAGRVLSVLVAPVELEHLPSCLPSVTLLEPADHVPYRHRRVHRLAHDRRRRVLARAADIAPAGLVVLALLKLVLVLQQSTIGAEDAVSGGRYRAAQRFEDSAGVRRRGP